MIVTVECKAIENGDLLDDVDGEMIYKRVGGYVPAMLDEALSVVKEFADNRVDQAFIIEVRRS